MSGEYVPADRLRGVEERLAALEKECRDGGNERLIERFGMVRLKELDESLRTVHRVLVAHADKIGTLEGAARATVAALRETHERLDMQRDMIDGVVNGSTPIGVTAEVARLGKAEIEAAWRARFGHVRAAERDTLRDALRLALAVLEAAT